MKLILVALLTIILVSSTILSHAFVEGKSKDSKAKEKIIKAIGTAVEGRYSTIKLIQLSKSNVTGYILAYNNTKAVTPPSPPPTPPPVPTPTPTGKTTKIVFIGDVDSTAVRDAIKNDSPDFVVVSGDLGYRSSLSWFKTNYGDVFGSKLHCNQGNHDSSEDSSSSMSAETLAFCGDHWSFTTGNGTTLVIGLNTNGNEQTQINFVKSLPLTKYKNVIITSHKNGHVPPNAHHPAEAADLYTAIESIPLSNTKLYSVTAHNHQMSSTSNGLWWISGMGGHSKYTCGTSALWDYCQNQSYGFLEFVIDNSNGNIVGHFYDTNNKLLH